MTLSCVLLIQPDFIIVIYELCHLFNFCYNNNHVHTTRTLIIGKEILNMENRSTQVCVIIKHMIKVQLVMKCVCIL